MRMYPFKTIPPFPIHVQMSKSVDASFKMLFCQMFMKNKHKHHSTIILYTIYDKLIVSVMFVCRSIQYCGLFLAPQDCIVAFFYHHKTVLWLISTTTRLRFNQIVCGCNGQTHAIYKILN